MNTHKIPHLLTTLDTARILGVSRMTVLRWIKGEGVDTPLPAKKVGRGYRIVGEELQEWINDDNSHAA